MNTGLLSKSMFVLLFCSLFCGLCNAEVKEFNVSDFGVVGDGNTDDGPAIAKAFKKFVSHEGSAKLVFERNKTYRIASLPGSIARSNNTSSSDKDKRVYLFSFVDINGKQIDGNGCHFSIRFPLKLVYVNHCENISIGNFSFEYNPVPFTQGYVCGIDIENSSLDIKLMDGYTLPNFDAPEVENNPAWHFCWAYAPHGHVWTKTIKEISPEHTKKGIFRVFVNEQAKVNLKRWNTENNPIAVPALGVVDGVGQCQSGTHSAILGSKNIFLENIRQYNCPHFSFQVNYNKGLIHFKNVDIMPREGTKDLISSWRDGFHVKTNTGPIIVEDCDMKGLRDDCINISSIALTAEKKFDDKTYQIRVSNKETFPEIKAGFTIQGWDPETGKGFGPAKIEKVIKGKGKGYWNVIVRLDRPLTGLTVDGESVKTNALDGKRDMSSMRNRLWVSEYINAGSIIRNNHFDGTVRFRAPGLYENNVITEFMIIKPDKNETPIAHDMAFKGNSLSYASIPSVFSVWRGESPIPLTPYDPQNIADKLVKNIIFENNHFERPIYLFDAQDCVFKNNTFKNTESAESLIVLRNTKNVSIDTKDDVKKLGMD